MRSLTVGCRKNRQEEGQEDREMNQGKSEII